MNTQLLDGFSLEPLYVISPLVSGRSSLQTVKRCACFLNVDSVLVRDLAQVVEVVIKVKQSVTVLHFLPVMVVQYLLNFPLFLLATVLEHKLRHVCVGIVSPLHCV